MASASPYDLVESRQIGREDSAERDRQKHMTCLEYRAGKSLLGKSPSDYAGLSPFRM